MVVLHAREAAEGEQHHADVADERAPVQVAELGQRHVHHQRQRQAHAGYADSLLVEHFC